MHEMAIAQSLLDIVLQHAAEQPGKVTRIKLQVGQMTQVVPDALEFGFQALAQGTVAEKAVLDIEIVPLTVHCESCRHTFSLGNYRFLCPKCQSTQIKILTGRELAVEYLEVE